MADALDCLEPSLSCMRCGRCLWLSCSRLALDSRPGTACLGSRAARLACFLSLLSLLLSLSLSLSESLPELLLLPEELLEPELPDESESEDDELPALSKHVPYHCAILRVPMQSHVFDRLSHSVAINVCTDAAGTTICLHASKTV